MGVASSNDMQGRFHTWNLSAKRETSKRWAKRFCHEIAKWKLLGAPEGVGDQVLTAPHHHPLPPPRLFLLVDSLAVAMSVEGELGVGAVAAEG